MPAPCSRPASVRISIQRSWLPPSLLPHHPVSGLLFFWCSDLTCLYPCWHAFFQCPDQFRPLPSLWVSALTGCFFKFLTNPVPTLARLLSPSWLTFFRFPLAFSLSPLCFFPIATRNFSLSPRFLCVPPPSPPVSECASLAYDQSRILPAPTGECSSFASFPHPDQSQPQTSPASDFPLLACFFSCPDQCPSQNRLFCSTPSDSSTQ